MRFPRAGVNWEGRPWILHPAVAGLASLVEERWPIRHPADGTVASRAHDATNPGSDHRPYPYTGSGVVAAIDVGETREDDGFAFAEALRRSRDSRLKYVIHEGRLFSSYAISSRRSWEWGPYTGTNPHGSHVHVSVYRDAGTGPWSLDLGGDGGTVPPTEDEMAISVGDSGRTVRALKKGFNAWLRAVEPDPSGTRPVDETNDDYGPAMADLVKRFQAWSDLPATGDVDGLTFAALARWELLEAPDAGAILPHNHDGRYPRRGEQITLP